MVGSPGGDAAGERRGLLKSYALCSPKFPVPVVGPGAPGDWISARNRAWSRTRPNPETADEAPLLPCLPLCPQGAGSSPTRPGRPRRSRWSPPRPSPTNGAPDVSPHNPLGKVPALILEDGTCLYDSRVICEYLDMRSEGAHLFPEGGERWDALTRQALADGILDAALIAPATSAPSGRSPCAGTPGMPGRSPRSGRGLDRIEALVPTIAGPRHRHAGHRLRPRLPRFPLSRPRLARGPSGHGAMVRGVRGAAVDGCDRAEGVRIPSPRRQGEGTGVRALPARYLIRIRRRQRIGEEALHRARPRAEGDEQEAARQGEVLQEIPEQLPALPPPRSRPDARNCFQSRASPRSSRPSRRRGPVGRPPSGCRRTSRSRRRGRPGSALDGGGVACTACFRLPHRARKLRILSKALNGRNSSTRSRRTRKAIPMLRLIIRSASPRRPSRLPTKAAGGRRFLALIA